MIQHEDRNGSSLNIDSNFELDNDVIRDLMRLNGREGIDKINKEFGGVFGLAARLKTNIINGIIGDENDIKKRMAVFGKNEIPSKPPKSFLQLVFHALKDTTLVILIVCAFISIGLSFYHPPEEVLHEEKIMDKESSFIIFIFLN